MRPSVAEGSGRYVSATGFETPATGPIKVAAPVTLLTEYSASELTSVRYNTSFT